MIMETKVCKKCGRELPIEKFFKDPKNAYGLKGNCKDCISEYQRERKLKMKSKQEVEIKDAPKVSDSTLKELSENHIEKIPSRLLISELRRRGYRGQLELVTIQKVVI